MSRLWTDIISYHYYYYYSLFDDCTNNRDRRWRIIILKFDVISYKNYYKQITDIDSVFSYKIHLCLFETAR